MLEFADEDAFAAWVSRFPSLAAWVLADIQLVDQMMAGSSGGALLHCSPAALLDMRDALARLHAVASEAGFVDVAAFFYQCYERCCRALLPFWPGGMEVGR